MGFYDFLDLMREYTRYMEAKDLPAIRRLLSEHPELLNDPECAAIMMIDAARHYESPELLALLHEFGVSLDISEVDNPITRPLNTAAYLERWENVRWLVEHGAELNWEEPPDEPRCPALPPAIQAGRLDIVKLLVEAGARLDVCDRTNRTPLQWAIESRQTEIAEYLRSRGAILSEQARNYRPPPPRTPVVQYIERALCRICPLGWQPVIPTSLPTVTVYAIIHEDFVGVFTDGMSQRAMAVPPGKERYRFAELALPLGEYWPEPPQRWNEEPYVWAVQWLLRLAAYPFETGTWLGDPYCVIANGEPPEPLSPYTRMTCWLLLADKAPLRGFVRPDGTEVVFYTLVPIHTAERDFERRYGLRALLKKFAKADVPSHVDPHRESVV